MKTTRWIACLGLVAILAAGSTTMAQQDQGRDRGERGDRGDRGGRFDPAQMRERMMGMYKEQLEVTDETEWKVIEPLISKVMEARLAAMSGAGRGFGGGPGMMGAGRPGGEDRTNRSPFGQANPEAEALQRAVDGKASNAELKNAVARYAESRKAKQSALEKAQDDLRKVLSVRQEAIATLRGLL